MTARRRAKSSADEYFITGPEGRTRLKHATRMLALIEAQNMALVAGDPATFTVTRRSLVGAGPEVELYRVERYRREETGGTLMQTFILSRDD